MRVDVCPLCGSNEIGEGKQMGHGKVYPADNLLMTFGSNVIHYICTDCGYIIASRVEKPEKFK